MSNYCVCCGEEIPDGSMICLNCLYAAEKKSGKKHSMLYTKWILGYCRHLCLFCKYRKEMKQYCKKNLTKK